MSMMKLILKPITFVFAVALLAACAAEPETLPKPGAQTGPRFRLTLEPGPYYAYTVRKILFSYTVRPQVAVWVENPDGSYIDTIFVTETVVSNKFIAAPKQGRPEALPVWSHLDKENVDAVSAPTAAGDTVAYGSDLAARLPAGTYVVKLETNRSYDWNNRYTKQNAGVNGQPSIVYRAELTLGGDRAEAVFQPFGTGSVDGSSGAVRDGLAGIDTALHLFSSLSVAYETD